MKRVNYHLAESQDHRLPILNASFNSSSLSKQGLCLSSVLMGTVAAACMICPLTSHTSLSPVPAREGLLLQQPEYGLIYGLISDYGRQCLTEIVKDLSGCDDKGFKVAGFCRDIPEY